MIFALFLAFALIYLWFKPTAGLKRFELPAFFAVKIVVAFIFMYVYSKIYGVGAETVDWEEFIHDSVLLRNVAFQDFSAYLKFLFGFSSEADVQQYLMDTNHWAAGDLTLMNDSRNVLRVNSLIAFVFNGNVYAHIGFISFFVVLCVREVYKTFKDSVWMKPRMFWWGLILLPTVLFWTTSMLKEPFMFMGLCLLLAGLFGKYSQVGHTWRFVSAILLLLGFKPYVLICLIIPLFIYLVWKFFRINQVLQYTIVLIAASIFLIKESNLRSNVVHRLTRMQFDFVNVGRGGIHVNHGENFYYFEPKDYHKLTIKNDSVWVKQDVNAKLVTTGMKLPFNDVHLTPADGAWRIFFIGETCGSYFDITPINNSPKQLIKNIPEALINAGIRPYPWDDGGKLKLLNFVESIFLFSFLIFSLFWNRIKRGEESRQVVILLLAFSLLLLMLIGWTTPILGALVRYRMPAYFALFLIACLGKRKIQKING